MGADAAPAEDEGKLPTVAEGEENLEGLKVEELKERCRTAGLKVSGAKAELVARLKEHSSSSSSKEEKKEESKDEANEDSKDLAKEEAKEEESKEEAKEDQSKEEAKEEAKVLGSTEEAKEDAKEAEDSKKDVKETEKEADKPEADAKDDSKEKHEDMLAEDAEEESTHKETAEKSKGSADAESDADGQPDAETLAREASASKAVDIDSDAEGPPLKIARKGDVAAAAADDQEDRKASRPSSPAAGNRRSRSRSGSSGSRKGAHRKEEPVKITGNPEDREKARLRMNSNERTRMNTNERSFIRSNAKLKDSDIERILQEHDEDEYGYQTVDFSRNSITAKGMEDIASICKKCPQLKILKLFSNAIDDEGAEKLAEIFQRCKGIEEIHLSHNKFTEKGVETIIEAADEELPKDYPRPLWLRMEHNDIKDPRECVENIESKFKSVCIREDRYKCLPRACVKGCRIHLPFLVDRFKGEGKGERGKGRDKGGGSYRDNDRWGRNRSPPRRRSPPRQNYRQSYRDAPRGRYNSRSRSPRDRTPPSRRDRAPAQDTRRGGGRQHDERGSGREQPPPRRSETSRHESQRPAPTLTARGAAGKGAYQRAGAAAHESDEYSYEYSDVSVEPPPGRAMLSGRDSGRGRAAPGGARIPPPRDNRDNSRRSPPRSAYHGSSVRMGPSGRTR